MSQELKSGHPRPAQVYPLGTQKGPDKLEIGSKSLSLDSTVPRKFGDLLRPVPEMSLNWYCPSQLSDCGILVVKVTDSWLACHEFEPVTAEDPPYSGGRCTLNMSQLKRPPVDVVGLLGNEVADDLAKAATSNPVDPENHMILTSTEIYSRAKELICRTWVVPPVHPWYFQRHPGSTISFKGPDHIKRHSHDFRLVT
ncbi:RNase H domain-containing protein [Trichonephila clavipes]|nr:RNase H domain-containing protein [Trichonephila clavipes]